MNKQEIIDYLKGQTEWSGNHHYILVNKSELISMIEDLDELEFKNYLRDIKSQIDYLRIQGPGKVKSLRMLENMVDNMLTGYWSSTSIRTEKVKVPAFVAEKMKRYKSALWMLSSEYFDTSSEVDSDELANWIDQNSEKFFRAWLDGYEVEEEPKYYVELPFEEWDEDAAELKAKSFYLGFDITSDETRFMATKKGWRDFKTKLDEETIRSIDERFWPFAVPVEKV